MTIAPVSAAHLSTVARPSAAPAAAPTSGADFAAAMEDARPVAELPASAPLPGRGSRTGELEPFVKFESFVLRTFVESMLPDENTSFFGSGTAGEIWKSMLAERIGDEIAAGGGIGIADMLAADDASAARAGDARDAMATAADSVTGLSSPDGK